jgi:CheY-like chemotaxis protein
MSFQPKRPSTPNQGAVNPVNPAHARPSTAPGPNTPNRPSSVRDAMTEGAAMGGAVGRLTATAGATAKKMILIVHPDGDLRARLKAQLETFYEVLEAKDGMEAVEMTSSIATPAMIVSDTTMPRVDGFTLAKILRNNPVMKKVPIMFVSAQYSPQHVTQALVIGVSQYFPKSTPVPTIVEKIRKIVV